MIGLACMALIGLKDQASPAGLKSRNDEQTATDRNQILEQRNVEIVAQPVFETYSVISVKSVGDKRKFLRYVANHPLDKKEAGRLVLPTQSRP